MNNILQKRILELSHQNNLLREEIEKLKKNLLNEARVKVICDGQEVWVDEADVHDAINDGCHEAGGSYGGRRSGGYGGGRGGRSSYTPRPQRDLAGENAQWHAANVAPLIDKHGLGEHKDKLDEHGVPHPEHMETVGQHANFGAYVRDLKAAHEKGFAESKTKNRSGKGSRWHVDAFGKLKPLLRR
jgi:hypothetical protein